MQLLLQLLQPMLLSQLPKELRVCFWLQASSLHTTNTNTRLVAEVKATEPATAEAPAPTTAEAAPAVAEPANTETGEPPYIIGTLVKAHSTDTSIAAPEAPKVEEPIKNEPSAPIVAATAPQL